MSGLKLKHFNLTSRSLTVKKSDWTPWFDHEITFDEKFELWNPSSCNYIHLILTFAIYQHPVFKHPPYYYPPWDRATSIFKTFVKPSDIKILLHILRLEEDKTILKWICNSRNLISSLHVLQLNFEFLPFLRHYQLSLYYNSGPHSRDETWK
jgi:hypothetical protein